MVSSMTALAVAAPLSSRALDARLRDHPDAITQGKHVLFRVRGPNGAAIYLLGSVHLLSAEMAKLPADVDVVFAQAKSVGFETNFDSLQMRAQEMIARARYPSGVTLRSQLSRPTLAHLDSVLPAYGLTIDRVNGFKPWSVSLTLAQLVFQKMNARPDLGVDLQLNARAKANGKPVFGLETTDFQLGLFDSLSPEDQEKMLASTVLPDAAAKELAAIVDAWSDGRTGTLDSLLNKGISDSPTMLATLVTNRNRTWIPKLENLISGRDDALVVVGAGHLLGRGGLVEMLRSKGYNVEQM